MAKQSLTEGWFLRAISNAGEVPGNIRGKLIPARVPGCVHTDLLRERLIEDPYFGQNEPNLFWIGRTDWEYTTWIDASAQLFEQARLDLVCDGLDTVATIILNDTEVARTQNMHRRYRFDVRPLLKKGKNELKIRFESPVNFAANMRDRLGYLPGIFYGGAYNFIRKMACNFGWDWGPIVPTCGVWKSIALEAWSNERLIDIRPVFRMENGTGVLDVFADVESLAKTNPPEVLLHSPTGESIRPESVSAKEGGYASRFIIRQPQLWWPKGYGDQPLYELSIDVAQRKHSSRVGLRTVDLDTHPDDIGSAFVVKVNDQPVFCKGFNWIPDDCFLNRACTSERYEKRIQQALDANANMLRVWGGGIYETDAFYDVCDRTGMLVWQDFLFACAAYPEAEPFKSEVEAEVRDNVARLAHHPSLVLWNGCNENVWMYHKDVSDDGTGKMVLWKQQLANRQWGQGYYFDLLPKLVKQIDPSRPYWAASPWSGDPDYENGLEPNLSTHGNKHIWEVWHGPGDYNNYRWFAPRFCSEFGYQGPANFATMHESFDPNELRRESATIELHQKSPGGNARNDKLLAKDFDIPAEFDDWHYLLQINQSRALQAGVEWFRSRQPRCMGTLYWQLNDCYPVTSWSAIDSAGRLKPLWYSTRRFYAPRILTIQPESDALLVYANNDHADAWSGQLRVRRMNFDGTVLHERVYSAYVPPRSNQRIAILPNGITNAVDRSREFIVATCGDERAFWYFLPDRDLHYPSPRLMTSLKGNDLTVRAGTFLRDLTLNADRIHPDTSVEDNQVTLLPGESFTFRLHNAPPALTTEHLARPPVMQCVNRFGKKGG